MRQIFIAKPNKISINKNIIIKIKKFVNSKLKSANKEINKLKDRSEEVLRNQKVAERNKKIKNTKEKLRELEEIIRRSNKCLNENLER